jgi:hypothetical protein
VAVVLLNHVHAGAHVDGQGVDPDPAIEEGEGRIGVAQAVGRPLVAIAVMEDASIFAERIKALLEALDPFAVRRAEDVVFVASACLIPSAPTTLIESTQGQLSGTSILGASWPCCFTSTWAERYMSGSGITGETKPLRQPK